MLYQLEARTFDAFLEARPDFAALCDDACAECLCATSGRRTQAAELVMPMRSLLKRPPVTIPLDALIRTATQAMAVR